MRFCFCCTSNRAAIDRRVKAFDDLLCFASADKGTTMLVRLLIVVAVVAGVLMVVTGQSGSDGEKAVIREAEKTGEEVRNILQQGADRRGDQIEAASR